MCVRVRVRVRVCVRVCVDIVRMLWRGSSVLFASTCATKQVSLPFLPYIEDEWTTLESRFVPLKDAIVYGSYTTRIILWGIVAKGP
mgnify:FL=1